MKTRKESNLSKTTKNPIITSLNQRKITTETKTTTNLLNLNKEKKIMKNTKNELLQDTRQS